MLNKYRTLITSLPVKEHGFLTKREIWKKYEDKYEWLKIQNDRIFGDKEERTITRGELLGFLKSNPNRIDDFLLLTIYWGYPSGMRGNYFSDIIETENREKTMAILDKLMRNNAIDDFQKFYTDNIAKLKGIGLSTFSKFLYFMETKVEGELSTILDMRLIDVLKTSDFKIEQFDNLKYENAHKYFVEYLKYIDEEAKKIGATSGQIEMFLFIFGKILNFKNESTPSV